MNAKSTHRVAAAIARTPVAPELSPAEQPALRGRPRALRRHRLPAHRVAAACSCREISLGLWHNFGDDMPFANQRALVRRAFDLGVTQFDLANNYGPPFGSAEENFGRIFAKDLRPYRDELVITTKAGWDMWPGPYGFLGSRKYVLASLDESLARMGLDHVDIFYSHRFDPDTPARGDDGRAGHARSQQGKARYVGISSYSPERTRRSHRHPRRAGHAAAHPPAQLLDVQPLDRGRPARRARRGRGGLHPLLAPRPGPADRPLSGGHPGRQSRQPGQVDVIDRCSARRTWRASAP